MRERSEATSIRPIADGFSMPASAVPDGRRWGRSLRALGWRPTAWWRHDETGLRTLAAFGSKRTSDIGKEPRALRRAARRRFRLHP